MLLVHNKKVTSLANLFGWVIQKTTRSRWNHVAIVINIKNTLMVYEAIGRGCMPTQTLDKWIAESDSGLRDYILIRQLKHNAFNARVIETMGSRYDYASAFWFHALKLLIKRWVGYTGTHAQGRFYCSELAAYLLGLQEWWTYTPKDLAIKFGIKT